MTAPHDISVEDLAARIVERGQMQRSITAVCGPPGAGKSTLSDELAAQLNEKDPGSAAVFPMDGYHFDDLILNARGWRPRKGAPHTFDVGGFRQMLIRLKRNEEDEIAVPVFDRSIEIARNSARVIPRSVRHLIVEGNYLLLDEAPWRDLGPLFDTTVFLNVPLTELERRLAERWQGLSETDRKAKLEENDLPNARKVVSGSLPAEFQIVFRP
ncbi:nucleoside/nucleotide kinase family protein [uncultured Roseibium sp.]|uniref:nucleoside/nucleotide kinase family protein n=1 Tax=uncultured Roseibium sp. TaxID=1936171 RepID=UPI0026299C98|nr:nucleoside/nucleotide kinase family protein [uncultured Roseibium sp.]